MDPPGASLKGKYYVKIWKKIGVLCLKMRAENRKYDNLSSRNIILFSADKSFCSKLFSTIFMIPCYFHQNPVEELYRIWQYSQIRHKPVTVQSQIRHLLLSKIQHLCPAFLVLLCWFLYNTSGVVFGLSHSAVGF